MTNVSRGRRSVEDRFWSKVDKNGPTVSDDLGPCWVWTGSKLKGGYETWSHVA